MLSPLPTYFSRYKSLRSRLIGRWHGLAHYWQHFLVAVILGIAIEAAIHAAHDFRLVKQVQNAVLDATLRFFSQVSKPDAVDQPLPLLIVTDDVTTQSPQWGDDKGMTLPQVLQLAGHAFDRGADHVFLDITFDASLSNQATGDRAALETFLKRYAEPSPRGPRHLYVARSARVDPCFPRDETLESLRPSLWDAVPGLDLTKRPGLVIHPVLPHYRADADHVVRGWDLFGVLRTGGAADGAFGQGWRFLPSPQLAYLTAQRTPTESLQTLPWFAPAGGTVTAANREGFAAAAVEQLPLLSSGKFGNALCTHHPETLGCPVRPTNPSTIEGHGKNDPQAMLAQINTLLRPLPAEHACRAVATERVNMGHGAVDHHQPHDLLFNRIVYSLPSWEKAPELEQRGYYLRTPLTLENDTLDWTGRLVAIGAAHASSGDWHPTPIGRIPGVLINLNAMQSLDKIGPVSSPPGWLSLLINGLIIVAVAAVFSAMSPMAAASLSAALLIGSLAVFHQYLLSRGIWIEFGAPLIGINLHRIIDGYLARRRLEAQVAGQTLPAPLTAHPAIKTTRRKKKGTR